MRRFLHWLTWRLDSPRVIPGAEEGSGAYLYRWYLTRERPKDNTELPGQSLETGDNSDHPPLDLFLHRFVRSDGDGELHSHPWEWGVSFMLAGGYWEERRVGDRVVRRLVKPFRFNLISADTYHRVELVEPDAWSLFLVGPKLTTWYFWNRERCARMRWNIFIRSKRGKCAPQWEPDSREAA